MNCHDSINCVNRSEYNLCKCYVHWILRNWYRWGKGENSCLHFYVFFFFLYLPLSHTRWVNYSYLFPSSHPIRDYILIYLIYLYIFPDRLYSLIWPTTSPISFYFDFTHLLDYSSFFTLSTWSNWFTYLRNYFNYFNAIFFINFTIIMHNKLWVHFFCFSD